MASVDFPQDPRYKRASQSHRGNQVFENPYLLTLAMLAGVALLRFLSIQVTRLKIRRLATRLGGEYASKGLFRLGMIEGNRGAMHYVLLSDANISCLAMPVANRGMAICVGMRFYRDFPDWNYVHSVGDRVERCLVVRLRRRDVAVPLGEELRPKVLRLLREFKDRFAEETDRQFATGSLWIHEGRMEFQCLGVLKDIGKIDRILQYMADVAVRLDYLPVEEGGP